MFVFLFLCDLPYHIFSHSFLFPLFDDWLILKVKYAENSQVPLPEFQQCVLKIKKGKSQETDHYYSYTSYDIIILIFFGRINVYFKAMTWRWNVGLFNQFCCCLIEQRGVSPGHSQRCPGIFPSALSRLSGPAGNQPTMLSPACADKQDYKHPGSSDNKLIIFSGNLKLMEESW